MKKLILLGSSASILCAGPMIQPLIDYDKQDTVIAKTEVKQKLIIPVTTPPIVTAPGVRKKTFGYEFDLLAGKNFADNSSLLKDTTTLGIRLHKYLTDDIAIQFGYDRIFDADYKFNPIKENKALKNVNIDVACHEICPPCVCPPCETDNGSGNIDNGDQNEDNDAGHDGGGTDGNDNQTGDQDNGWGNDQGSGDDNGNGGENDQGSGDDNGNGGENDQGSGDNSGNGGNNGNGGNGESDNGSTPENPINELGTKNATRSTDIDRFYINALKEIHGEKTNFIPYFFAGLGYEHVNDKNLGIDSQGFFNTGGGLKYSLNEKFKLVSEAKIIKKFKDEDLDIVAMLGVGILFGKKEETPIQNGPKVTDVNIEPQKQDLSLIIDDRPYNQSEPIQIVKIQTPVTIPTVTIDAPTTATVNKKSYYIQVAVVSTKEAMNNYLQKLQNSGLSTEIKPTTVRHKDANRILVGPYTSRFEAMQDLLSVRKVEKGAFIKKL